MGLTNNETGSAGLSSSGRNARRNLLGACCTALFLTAGSVFAFFLQGAIPPSTRPSASRTDHLLDTFAVRTARLHVEPDQWETIEPKGGPGPFGPGGPGGPPGPGRSGSGPGSGPNESGKPGGSPFGPGGSPPKFGDFGPGNFVAPIFMERGDENHDKRLSPKEIRALADRWFTDWDKDRTGKLTSDQLRDGLNVALMPQGTPPGFGGPGGRPGGARPGGPGGMGFQAADGKRNGIVGVMGLDFEWVRAALEIDGQPMADVSVRLKGNGTFLQSRGDLKRSFKVRFAKGATAGKLGGPSKLNFHSNVTDASLMNETLAYRLYRDAGVPAPRTSFSRVYLTVPGKYDNTYVGLFSIVENIDNHFAVDRFGTKKGVFFKPVAKRLFEDLGDKWEAYRKAYDPKTPISTEEEQHVIEFCKLVSHATDGEFDDKLEHFLDLDEFSRFMAATVWLSTMDSILAMDQNYIVYLHPKTRTFQFIPWDLDHSFGQFFAQGTSQQRENLSIHKPWTGEFPFMKRVFGVERFKRLYLAQLKEINETLGQPERIHRQVDELAKLLRPAVADESPEKLSRFDKVVAGETVSQAGFGGGFGGPQAKAPPGGGFPQGGPPMGGAMGSSPKQGPPMGPPGMFGEIKPIKGFVTARYPSVRDQLAGTRKGDEIGVMGFGPPGGPGPGKMPAGFGPGMFWAPLLMSQFDTNKDNHLDRDELVEGFERWFHVWDTEKTGSLSEDQIRAGLNKIFSAMAPGPGPGFGPGSGPPGDPSMEFPSDPDFESPDDF
jgi:spore coat protein H